MMPVCWVGFSSPHVTAAPAACRRDLAASISAGVGAAGATGAYDDCGPRSPTLPAFSTAASSRCRYFAPPSTSASILRPWRVQRSSESSSNTLSKCRLVPLCMLPMVTLLKTRSLGFASSGFQARRACRASSDVRGTRGSLEASKFRGGDCCSSPHPSSFRRCFGLFGRRTSTDAVAPG